MESKDWSGFGYFSPNLEKIKQLLVCSKHHNTWEDTGNVVKVFLSTQSKMKNVRQWKETDFSKLFVVKAATSLLLNSIKICLEGINFLLSRNSWIFEILSGCKIETKVRHNTICPSILSREFWFCLLVQIAQIGTFKYITHVIRLQL